ncbi:hypothetical protein WA026_016078 [Henosepilachna vigintioctopunctata]|uniref:Uncharacterized protein n=1 Tax=Henosepilachna vigintioctopunctata TaxID=420089 RepID=A0AAW1UCR6_9CUCU
MLAAEGDNQMKYFKNTENEFLTNAWNSCESVSSNKKGDKNNYVNTVKGATKANHEEKVRKLIEKIKIKQGYKRKLQNPNMSFSDKTDQILCNSKQMEGAETYKYRFEAQKNIIEQQKFKLQEKEKIINELRVGIMTEEVKEFQNKSKLLIRELFQDCKIKMAGKVPLDYLPTNGEKLWIKTKNAPKILQQLEKRAFDRMKYREMIRERKKLLDETKKKIHEELLEQKKYLEEEEKKKQLELMKEKRKEELIKIKMRQINKEKFLENLEKAKQQYQLKLLKYTFLKWKLTYKWSLDKKVKGDIHYKTCLLKKSINTLLNIVEMKYSMKYEMADVFHRKLILGRTFNILKERNMERIRAMQVAEDFYDFNMQYKIFKRWHKHMSKEKILTDIKMQQAILQYKKTIIFRSFFQWKSLPTVLKLEKVKEERKQKWRKKVWEILPDYQPSEI